RGYKAGQEVQNLCEGAIYVAKVNGLNGAGDPFIKRLFAKYLLLQNTSAVLVKDQAIGGNWRKKARTGLGYHDGPDAVLWQCYRIVTVIRECVVAGSKVRRYSG